MPQQDHRTALQRTLAALFARRHLCTLLDTAQLMSRPDFRNTHEGQHLSQIITVTAVATNLAVLACSALLSMTVFRGTPGPRLLLRIGLTEAGLVIVSYYIGAVRLAEWAGKTVEQAKTPLLLSYEPQFMLHFDTLAASYDLDEKVQTEGIFREEQRQAWLQGYLQVSFPSN